VLTRVDTLVRRLHQGAIWVSRGDGDQPVVQRLDDMPRRHQQAALAWLREHAVELHGRQGDDLTRRATRAGGHPDDLVELSEHSRLDPHVWLEETVLVRRFVELIGRDPAPPRRRRFLPRWLRR
jgi:hypothetical protein